MAVTNRGIFLATYPLRAVGCFLPAAILLPCRAEKKSRQGAMHISWPPEVPYRTGWEFTWFGIPMPPMSSMPFML